MKLIKFGCLLLTSIALLDTAVVAQQFTLQIGSPPPPPTVLVNHTNIWRFHKGTNAPQSGWTNIADVNLDSTWGSGPGGFGYSTDTPNETNQCRTILSDMRGSLPANYSTFYIRRSFEITGAEDPSMHIQFTIDYDDGFVAYLDGKEVQRSANVPGSVGTEPPNTAAATSTHESSRGTSAPVNPPAVFDLGTAASLTPGTHVLALIGLNASPATSSDFILIADLALIGGTGGTVVPGKYFSLVSSNQVVLSGTNTIAGSTRVTVNGDDASFNSSSGAWNKTQSLVGGVNKLFIAAHDAAGAILYATNVNIVAELSSTQISGVLPANSVWNSSMGIIHVTANASVPAAGSLRIEDGAVVLLGAGVSIQATDASLTVTGTYSAPIYFLPADGTAFWGELVASGNSGLLSIQHAETASGHIEVLNGATGIIQDSYIHDYQNGSTPIVHTDHAASLTYRRNHVQWYYEHLIQRTPVVIEDCICENIVGDGIDFDAGPPGSAIRRCTMRHGDLGNVDAFDLGEVSASEFTDGVIVENNLVFDFPFDKGVSLGIARNIIVRSNLISHCNSGVAIKDSSTAYIYNNTFADVEVGLNLYKKPGTATQDGGHVQATNNIIWGVTTNVHLDPLSTITVGYTDLQGNPVYTGDGNINTDPLFVNAATRDYRVQFNSPTIGTAFDGGDMGAQYPVGGIPTAPLRLAVLTAGTAPLELLWVDDSENEDGFAIERSTDATSWIGVIAVGPGTTNYTDSTALLGQKYYYRVRASNGSGDSPFSNIAAGTRQSPTMQVGGAINANTLWQVGTHYIVTSSVTIASSATLTIQPGVTVCFNTGVGMTIADGGRLLAVGTSNAPILFTRSPNNATTWTGLTFNGSVGSPETQIAYARFEFTSQNPCLRVSAGTVFFDHLTFGNTAASYIHVDGASFIIQNCVFPSATSQFELCHGTGGIKSGGHGIFQRNFFGIPIGYNDVVDFTGGNRPGPIIHFIDNVFSGASDDILDLDGTDAWVEHNIFLHSHKNGSPDTSSCVSGSDDGGNTSQITVVGNLAYDIDHFAMGKGGNFYTILNNTIVHQNHGGGTDTDGAVLCLADEGFGEAAGMYMEGNIIYDAEKLLRFHTNSIVTFTNNIISTNATWTPNLVWSGPGGNNSTNDPLLKLIPQIAQTTFASWADAQVLWDWFSLKSNSPAIASGPNGLDKGGVIPIGASLSGAPQGSTTQSNATLIVGINRTGSGIPATAAAWPNGAGYTHYKWRLDGGAWSAETPLSTPISLANLAQGLHNVEVSGKRDSALYQDDAAFGSDGAPTRASWYVGTLAISNVSMSGPSTVQIQFNALAGTGYTIEYRDSLSTGSWLPLVHLDPPPSNQLVTFPDTLPMGVTKRFYRLTIP